MKYPLWAVVAAVVVTLSACSDPITSPDISFRASADCVRDYNDQSQCSTVHITADPSSTCDAFGNCTVNCNEYPSLCTELIGEGGGGGVGSGSGSGGGIGGIPFTVLWNSFLSTLTADERAIAEGANPAEIAKCMSNLAVCQTWLRASARAIPFAQLYGATPDAVNALRHAMWQAQMTYDYASPAEAEAWAAIHEQGSTDLGDTCRDLINNQIGRSIGQQARNQFGNDRSAALEWIKNDILSKHLDGDRFHYPRC